MSGMELVLVNRWTGEQLDVANATDEDLATFYAAAEDAKGELDDLLTEANRELVRRLDRAATWTRRVGDPQVRQYEIVAPSPTAGTEVYPELRLEGELLGLYRRKIIDRDGAAGALKRELVMTFEVPIDAERSLEDLAREARETIAVTLGMGEQPRVRIYVTRVDVVRKAVAAGIARLRKVKGTRAALDRALERKPTGERKARVKPIGRS